jgi:lipopolysaccharide/colanic/teichoic acid biosynthesis glycosyltransferase
MKRALDILLSSIALFLLSPLLVPVAVILRCTGEGYVFYRQQRVGKNGQLFRLYKFATMLKDSPSLPGGLLTSKHDPRVLPFGRILRATKINEIPQLINVLLGDMSLIGPRPQAPAHFEVFPEHVKKEIVRVRPGLSGVGSILFRDEDSMLARCGKSPERFYSEDIAPYKGELEIWYVNRRSVPLDLLLILLTMWVVLFPGSRWYSALLSDLPQPESQVLADYLGFVPAGNHVMLETKQSSTARSSIR